MTITIEKNQEKKPDTVEFSSLGFGCLFSPSPQLDCVFMKIPPVAAGRVVFNAWNLDERALAVFRYDALLYEVRGLLKVEMVK